MSLAEHSTSIGWTNRAHTTGETLAATLLTTRYPLLVPHYCMLLELVVTTSYFVLLHDATYCYLLLFTATTTYCYSLLLIATYDLLLQVRVIISAVCVGLNFLLVLYGESAGVKLIGGFTYHVATTV